MKDCGGIRTLDDLKARCWVDDETGCWHWKLAKYDGAPRAMVYVCGKHQMMSGRRAALLLSGQEIAKGHRAFNRYFCQAKDCVNPDHTKSGTVRQHGAALAKAGTLKGIPSKVRAGRVNGRNQSKLSLELAREIRDSEETYQQLAERLGVDTKTIYGVKHNLRWKECANVLPTADVFAWAQQQRKAA